MLSPLLLRRHCLLRHGRGVGGVSLVAVNWRLFAKGGDGGGKASYKGGACLFEGGGGGVHRRQFYLRHLEMKN